MARHEQGISSPPDSRPYMARGRHLLVTLSGCPARRLDDLMALETLVRQAATATGATVLRVIGQRFQPQGVAVLALLAESHASLHTYPERGVAFWDCFTCGETCDPSQSIAVLAAALAPVAITREELVRAG
jgi:S-adenosylmethionine decarboxylase proenzyme